MTLKDAVNKIEQKKVQDGLKEVVQSLGKLEVTVKNPITEIDIKKPKWWKDVDISYIISVIQSIPEQIGTLVKRLPDVFRVSLEKGDPKKPQYVIPIDESGKLIKGTDGKTIVRGGSGPTQYVDGEHKPSSARGQLMMGDDGSNIQTIKTDSDGTVHVNTELPAATALADATATPTVPAVGAYAMGYNRANSNWDMASLAKLIAGNTSAPTVLDTLQIVLVTPGAGAASQIGNAFASPIYMALASPSAGPITPNVNGETLANLNVFYVGGMSYNEGQTNWTANRQAQLTYTNGIDRIGLPINALAGYYNSDPITRATTSNYFDHLQATKYQALFVHPRDSEGNELQESTEATLLASASRTTTQTSADIINYSGFRNLHVILDMTVVTASPDVTLTIEGKDPASGKYYTILAGTNVITVSTNVYRVGLGLPATANVSTNDFIPRTWRIVVTANSANAGTYSVGYSLIK